MKISKSICAAVFLSVFFRCGSDMILAYLAAFIHELSHFAVCFCLGVRVHGIKVGALGMCLSTEYVTDTAKKIIIASAGPVVSLLIFVCSAIPAVMFFEASLLYRFAFFNLCIAVINALPVMPLDGGVILKAVLTHKTGIIYGVALHRKITSFILTVMAILCMILFYMGYMSVSLASVIAFLVRSLKKEDDLCMIEKNRVLSGRINCGDKIRYVIADSRCRLLYLASHISHGFYVVAAVFEDGRFIGEINQQEIISCINKFGAFCTAQECCRRAEK